MNKLIITFLAFVLTALASFAQDYDIRSAGQGVDGKYYVQVTAVLDKKQQKQANMWLRRLAVDGVMFRGVAGSDGYPSQNALISDPAVRTLKAEFFEAFNNEELYNSFASLEDTSVQLTKLPKKKWEVSGRLLVNKEALLHFLGEHGIVETFDNLW